MSAPPARRLIVLLASGRVGFLPTIWTTVLVGSFLAALSSSQPSANVGVSLGGFVLACFLASSMVMGGAFLHNAWRLRWENALPSSNPLAGGELSPTRVAFAGYSLLAAGWFGGCVFESMLWAVHAPAEVVPAVRSITPQSLPATFYGLSYERVVLSSFLALAVLLFARFDRGIGTGGPVLMALGHGLLVLWAGSLAVSWFEQGEAQAIEILKHLLPYSLCILTYTLMVSMVAHRELHPEVRVPPLLLWILYLFPPLALTAFLSIRLPGPHDPSVIGLAVAAFLLWSVMILLQLPESASAFASGALSGGCLLNALPASFLGFRAVVLCFALFLVSLLLHRLYRAAAPELPC